MIGTFRQAPHPSRRRVLDPGFLGTRDRAVLELLHRADVATTAQLVTLVYRRRQTAQEHLVALYRAGWIERAVLPPTTRGGAPLAFRLSARARRRLGLGPLTRGRAGTQLRHSLNVTETVATLVRLDSAGPESHPVRAWLPERAAARIGLRDVFPDSIVALALPTGSAVLCLEIDQATEHAPVIRAKLARYEPVLRNRHWWGVLFVVESPVRAAYLARVGRGAECAYRLIGKALVTILGDLAAEGPSATLREITPGGGRTTLAAVLRDPRARRCSTPVGSDEWIELLGGGAEDTAEALA